MTPEQVREAAVQQGIAPQALDTLVEQTLAHFVGATPRPVDVAQYISTLSTWTKAGLTWEVFEKLPPGTRIALDRTHNPTPPPPVHARRPVTRALSETELTQLKQEGLTGAAYTERARQLQQTPLPPQQP